tara:strand:+ start:38 stop:328 length:291 start_codon:yes stop_codon:yes gene_type:complete
MSDLIEGAESSIELKEAPKTDWKGAFNFATIAVVGLLALLGMSFSDFLFKKVDNKPTKAANESKKDEDTVADYEKDYLDEDISEDALDEHTVGLTA